MALRQLLPLLLSLVLVPFWAAAPTGAQGAPPAWGPTGLTPAVTTRFGPASGALFAAAPGALYRSDDAGVTWAAVPLPAADAVAVVDPVDHRVVYAQTADGLYQSVDDSTTWRLVLPRPASGANLRLLA